MQSASVSPDKDCSVSPLGAVSSLVNHYHNDLLPESDLRMGDSIRLTPSIVLPISESNAIERVPSTFSSEHVFGNDFIPGRESNQYVQALDGYPDLGLDLSESLINPINGPSDSIPFFFPVETNEDICQLPTLSMQSTNIETSSPISPFTPGMNIQACIQPSPQTSDLTESSMVEYEELSSELSSELSDSTESLSDMSTMSFDHDSIELEDLCAGTLRPLMKMNNRRQPRRRMNRRQRTTIPHKVKDIVLHLYERYNTETGASIVDIAYTITEQYLKPEFQ